MALESLDDLLDIVSRYIKVSHEADPVAAADENALLLQIPLQSGEDGFFELEKNHVRLNFLRVDTKLLDLSETLG